MNGVETYTLCSDCGRRIPWGQPRVFLRFMEGSKVTEEMEVCVRWCATRVLKADSAIPLPAKPVASSVPVESTTRAIR